VAIVKQWGFTVNTDHFGMTCKNGQLGDMLFAASASELLDAIAVAHGQDRDRVAVGTYLDKPRGDNNNAVIGGQVWAAGIYDNSGSELPLIERR
jgi:hypothetical protein